MECAKVNNADRRDDNADSEGVGRLENANPLERTTNESSSLHRKYVNAPRSTPPGS
jgi:hypothetical protein